MFKCTFSTLYSVLILGSGFADTAILHWKPVIFCVTVTLFESSLCLCLSCFILFLMLCGKIWYKPYASFPPCLMAMRCFCVPRLCLGLPLPCSPGSGVCGTLTSAPGLCPVPNGIKEGRKKDGREADDCGGMRETGHWLLSSGGAGCLAGFLGQLEGLLGWAQGGWHAMRWGREFIPVIPIKMKTIRVKKGMAWFNFHSPERVC